MANEIISREEARAKGFKFFFSGTPCTKGHVCERFVANNKCIYCRREAIQKWDRSNKDKRRKIQTKCRAKNPNKYREKEKRWRLKNTDKIRKKNKKYKTENTARLAPLAIERTNKWRENNPEKLLENSRRFAHTRRSRKYKAGGSYTNEEIRDLLVKQNCQCASCSNSLLDGKELDHIYPISRGGSNWGYNLQWLCIPCNRRKRDKHPLVWLCEIGRLSMTDQERDAKIAELANLPTDAERLAAYHAFVKEEWNDLTGESVPILGATNGR